MTKRIVSLLLLLSLLLALPAAAEGEKLDHLPDILCVTVEEGSRVDDKKETYVAWEYLITQNESVNAELRALVDGFVAQMEPTMQKDPRRNASRNSRLDAHVVYSRTGESWLSTLVLGRVSFQRKQVASPFTTRTYDMQTGQRKLLTDLFPDDSAAWAVLRQGAREALETAFPSEQADADALDALCSDEGIRQADFTLSGMELTLHFPAEALYPEHHNILHARFYYPQFAGMMTEEGERATDNSRWKMVAVTCDDGPSYANSAKALNNMRKAGVRATYFVVGKVAEENSDILLRESDENFLIAGHSWSHKSGYSLKKMESRLDSVAKVDALLLDVIGAAAPYFRAPGGTYPPWIQANIPKPIIQWSVDTYDYRGRSANVICGHIRDFVQEGDIILMHDTSDHMFEAVPTWAEYLTERGFMMVTVAELAAAQGVTPENSVVYYRMLNGVYADRKDSNTN